MIGYNLTELGKFFDKLKISWKIEPATAENILEHLVIDLGEDTFKSPLLLHLSLFEKILEFGTEEAPKKRTKKPKFLNILYVFPFKIDPSKNNILARYLLSTNSSIEFPGFGMTESDQRAYFRYDLFCQSDKIDTQVLEGLLGYILFLIDTFGPSIEKLNSPESALIQKP